MQALGAGGRPEYRSIASSQSNGVAFLGSYYGIGGSANGPLLLATRGRKEIVRSTDAGKTWTTVSFESPHW